VLVANSVHYRDDVIGPIYFCMQLNGARSRLQKHAIARSAVLLSAEMTLAPPGGWFALTTSSCQRFDAFEPRHGRDYAQSGYTNGNAEHVVVLEDEKEALYVKW
jgi:hypothetical protein